MPWDLDNERPIYLQLITKSLKELGAGRSIVIDAEGEIIAGNAWRGCLAGFDYG